MAVDADRRRDIWRAYRAGEDEGRAEFDALVRDAYAAVARRDIDEVLEGFDPE